MTGPLLAMAAANAAVLLGAHELLLRVRLGRASLDLLLFLLLRLALLSGIVLLSLCTRTFNPLALGAAGGVALVALLASGAHRRLPRWRDPGAGPWILAVAAIMGIRLLLQAWFFAPYLGDVLSYHLPKIAEWVHAGGLTRELGADMRSSFPAGFELVEAWWTVFLHHDVLIEMAGVEFLALGAVAAGALARRLDLSPRGAALAALLYALVPGMHLQATACINDAPLASLFVTTATLIMSRAPWPLILLAAGLGVGVKPTFVYLSPGLALLAWRQRSQAVLHCPSPKMLPFLAALGLLVGGFWYARNTVVHGNPLHPMTSKGILNPNNQVLIPSSPSLANLGWNMVALQNRLDDRVGPYSSMLDGMAGWGIGPIALGLPALLFLLRREADLRLLAGAFALSLICLLCSFRSDPWYLRFALYLPSLLCIAAARMAEQTPMFRALGAAAVALQFLGTFAPNEIPNGGVRELMATPWRERQGNSPPLIKLPKDAVGIHPGALRTYQLYGPGLERKVVVLRSADLPALIEDLRRERLTLISAPRVPLIIEAETQGVLRRDLGDYYWVTR